MREGEGGQYHTRTIGNEDSGGALYRFRPAVLTRTFRPFPESRLDILMACVEVTDTVSASSYMAARRTATVDTPTVWCVAVCRLGPRVRRNVRIRFLVRLNGRVALKSISPSKSDERFFLGGDEAFCLGLSS